MTQIQPEPIRRNRLPEGLLAALIAACVMIGVFVGFTAALPLAPADRWAALTTFTLLAFACTLPGALAGADWLGRAARASGYSFAVLVAAVPVVFCAYAFAVRQLLPQALASAVLVALLPALLLWRVRHSRRPTSLDLIGLGYVWLVLTLGLTPDLGLPVVGARVSFFTLALTPLLLVLLAARGWPGIGYTWHLSGSDLRIILLGALIGLALGGSAWFSEFDAALPTIGRAVEIYFFQALPYTLLDHGVGQRSVMHALAPHPWLAPLLGIAVGALLAGGRAGLMADTSVWLAGMSAACAAVGYGWVYWRTGKVTAAAVSQMLVAWM